MMVGKGPDIFHGRTEEREAILALGKKKKKANLLGDPSFVLFAQSRNSGDGGLAVPKLQSHRRLHHRNLGCPEKDFNQ